jgi:hypothetical protein
VDDKTLPRIASASVAEYHIETATTQDAPKWSKRVWSATLSLGSSALLFLLLHPGTQEAVTIWVTANAGPSAPALIPLVGGLLALLSKAIDPRPTRGV